MTVSVLVGVAVAQKANDGFLADARLPGRVDSGHHLPLSTSQRACCSRVVACIYYYIAGAGLYHFHDNRGIPRRRHSSAELLEQGTSFNVNIYFIPGVAYFTGRFFLASTSQAFTRDHSSSIVAEDRRDKTPNYVFGISFQYGIRKFVGARCGHDSRFSGIG